MTLDARMSLFFKTFGRETTLTLTLSQGEREPEKACEITAYGSFNGIDPKPAPRLPMT
jgi:hypothetical protein